MTKQLPSIVQANTLLTEASSITITSPRQMEEATEFLSRANNTLKLLKTAEDEQTAALEEKLAAIKAPFKEPKKRLTDVIALVRAQASKYQTEQTRLANIEAQKIADRTAKGNLRPETAMRKLNEIDAPATKLTTESGSLSFRATPTLKIINQSLIPQQFTLPNEKLILETLKAGTPVPGCAIEIIQTPINRRG